MVKAVLPSNAGGAGSIPGRGAKIPHALWTKKQNIKQKQYCNKFNTDFKNGPHQKRLKKKKKERNQGPPWILGNLGPVHHILRATSTHAHDRKRQMRMPGMEGALPIFWKVTKHSRDSVDSGLCSNCPLSGFEEPLTSWEEGTQA